MFYFEDKGSIRGQRSNFRISKILMYTIDSKLKLNKKSIGDGPRAPKTLTFEDKGSEINSSSCFVIHGSSI